MDPNRGRFPIKLQRTDSPTSTLSSRRPYSRQDNRGKSHHYPLKKRKEDDDDCLHLR